MARLFIKLRASAGGDLKVWHLKSFEGIFTQMLAPRHLLSIRALIYVFLCVLSFSQPGSSEGASEEQVFQENEEKAAQPFNNLSCSLLGEAVTSPLKFKGRGCRS